MESPRYTCVGSGTGVPVAARGPACHLIEAGALRILMDLGSGSLRSLDRFGHRLADLSAVGVTHRHQDHVADLLPLLFALRNFPDQRPAGRLVVFGYPGLTADLERQAEVFGRWVLEPRVELEVREVPPGESVRVERNGTEARVTGHAVAHSPEAVGFRVEIRPAHGGSDRSWTVAYSGDSGATETLVALARDADLFVCECAFPDGEGVEGHLTPSEMLPICAAASPRRTVATHFYPAWERRGLEREWALALASFGSYRDVEPAWDGLRVELGDGSASGGDGDARHEAGSPSSPGPCS